MPGEEAPLPTRDRDYDEQELERIAGALAESVFEATDEELCEELREEGLDPDAEAESVREVLLGALQSHRKQRLQRARAEYDRRRQSLQDFEVELPPTPQGRLSLLQAALHQQPWLQGMMAAHRDLKHLADEDVVSYLQQLALLGLLDEL